MKIQMSKNQELLEEKVRIKLNECRLHMTFASDGFNQNIAQERTNNGYYTKLTTHNDDRFNYSCITALDMLGVDISPAVEDCQKSRIKKVWDSIFCKPPEFEYVTVKMEGDKEYLNEGLQQLLSRGEELMKNLDHRTNQLREQQYSDGKPKSNQFRSSMKLLAAIRDLNNLGNLYKRWENDVVDRYARIFGHSHKLQHDLKYIKVGSTMTNDVYERRQEVTYEDTNKEVTRPLEFVAVRVDSVNVQL